MRTNYKLLVAVITMFCFITSGYTQILKFRDNGKFKIVQFTDTHIKYGSEHSQLTIDMMNQVLDAEKPDLVIFTGDIVTGTPVKEGFEFVLDPVIRRQIPYAIVYGNHDDEQKLSRAELSDMLKHFPYNISRAEKIKDVTGYGNYVIEIKDKNDKKTAALLYCMDSNAYSTLKNKSVGGYGWFTADQIEWYCKQSNKYIKKNDDKPLPALAFFHIPFPEYKQIYIDTTYKYIGTQLEPVCSPDINTGMFSAMLHQGDVMGTFVGHDHNNDYIFNMYNIALAYGRFSGSKNTYGDLPNGARVIELAQDNRAFTTWIYESGGTIKNKVEFPKELPVKTIKK